MRTTDQTSVLCACAQEASLMHITDWFFGVLYVLSWVLELVNVDGVAGAHLVCLGFWMTGLAVRKHGLRGGLQHLMLFAGTGRLAASFPALMKAVFNVGGDRRALVAAAVRNAGWVASADRAWLPHWFDCDCTDWLWLAPGSRVGRALDSGYIVAYFYSIYVIIGVQLATKRAAVHRLLRRLLVNGIVVWVVFQTAVPVAPPRLCNFVPVSDDNVGGGGGSAAAAVRCVWPWDDADDRSSDWLAYQERIGAPKFMQTALSLSAMPSHHTMVYVSAWLAVVLHLFAAAPASPCWSWLPRVALAIALTALLVVLEAHLIVSKHHYCLDLVVSVLVLVLSAIIPNPFESLGAPP